MGDVIVTQAAEFRIGARVEKKSGSSWTGIIVGGYRTLQTPTGWCVESENEPGSVQIYPEKALRLATTPVQNRGEDFTDAMDNAGAFPADEVVVPYAVAQAAYERGYEACREDAARLCTGRAAGREQLYSENEAAINAHKAVEAEECATAIRNMEARNG